MTGDKSSPLVRRLACLALQIFQLENNLFLRRLHRPSKRRIELHDLLLQFRQHKFRLLDTFVKIPRQRFGHAGSFHLPPQFLRASPHVLDLQVVPLQQLLRFRVQQCERGARQNHRHPPQEMPVDHFRLRKIHNLRRARDTHGRRQQIILHHGPQQRVRTEALRLCLHRPNQFFASPRRIARLKFSVVHSNGLPQTLAHAKQHRAPRSHFHLRIKTCFIQFFRALQQFFRQDVAILQRPAIDGSRHAVQPRIQRIEQNESLLRKQPREQFSERASIGFFRAITFPQKVCQQVAAFVAEQRGRLQRHSFHLRAHANLPYGRPGLRHHWQFKPLQLARVEPCRIADFLEVVIFCRHPKNGHRLHARTRQLLSQLNRRQRLINGVRRSAKEAHLLSRDDRNRALLEPRQIFCRRFAQAESFILRAQSGSYFRPPLLGKFHRPRNAVHRLHCRRMRIKRRNFGKIVEELDKTLRRVGQLAKREGSTVHLGLDDIWCVWSQQTGSTPRPQARATAGSKAASRAIRRFFTSSVSGRSGSRGIPPRYPRWSMTNLTQAIPDSETMSFDALTSNCCNSRACSSWPRRAKLYNATHFSGNALASAKTAPRAPIIKEGYIVLADPTSTWNSGRAAAIISATRCTLPELSLMPMMFGCSESATPSGASSATPVNSGTEYSRIRTGELPPPLRTLHSPT